MIESRIVSLSCNEEEFDKVKGTYIKSLNSSGFKSEMKYAKPAGKATRQRNRNVIWFNPPYNAAVKTNIGKHFLLLINKHFPSHHKFAKLFNRNNLKLSYSCSPSMGSIISRHNKRILSKDQENKETNKELCNCRQHECPLRGHCLEKALIYKANVTTEGKTIGYIGCTESTFKDRFTKHKASFNHRHLASSTSLSSYVWKLKDKNIPYETSWEILRKSAPYKCGTRRCDLCLTEKMLILQADTDSILNKHSEIMQKCRHSNKYKLGAVK